MSAALASTIELVFALYLGAGIAFALPFAAVGAGRLDPDARAGSLGFRILIVPGAAALWPLLLVRWLRGPRPSPTPHDRAARGGGDG